MKKKIITILVILIVIVLATILFVKYKNLSITTDIVGPGNATIMDDPINGSKVILYKGEYTSISINIKNFFNTKVYPIIDNKDVIEYDEKNNMIIAKEEGKASIYFQSLFGLSKSKKINIEVHDKEFLGYTNDKTLKVQTISSLEKYPKVKFMSNDSLGKINEIYLDDNKVNIDNFILNGRTYINIYDYCNEIDCKVTKEDNTLFITKNISDTNFIVSHEINTDTFKTTIENGNQKLEYDIGSKYIDAKSCPSNGLECNDNTTYVPLRFLMQALGYTVTWDQKTNNVSINNYLYDKFNENNKIMKTDSLKNVGDKIDIDSNFEENKQLYLYVTDKDNIVQEFQVVLSFSSDVENGSTTDNIFEIKGNNIKLLDRNNMSNSKMKLLLIHDICDENDKSGCGSFPIVIDFNPTNVVSSTSTNSELGTTVKVDQSGGYPSTYTRGGITFKEYRQSIAPYNNSPYWGSTIGYKGCGPVAASIILSGYMDETPDKVASFMNSSYGYTGPDPLNGTLQHYGFTTELVNYTQGSVEQKEKLQNHLLNGGTALISVCTPKAGGDCINSPSDDFASTSHIMAILGIDPNNLDSVYISNPAITKDTGWQSLDYVLKHVRGMAYYILASK